MGGIFITKYGVRPMFMVFGISIMLGQFIFAFGCHKNSINIMFIGRIIFGLGGECINVCNKSMIFKWFYKSEMALPLGLALSLARFACVMNDWFSPSFIGSVRK